MRWKIITSSNFFSRFSTKKSHKNLNIFYRNISNQSHITCSISMKDFNLYLCPISFLAFMNFYCYQNLHIYIYLFKIGPFHASDQYESNHNILYYDSRNSIISSCLSPIVKVRIYKIITLQFEDNLNNLHIEMAIAFILSCKTIHEFYQIWYVNRVRQRMVGENNKTNFHLNINID